MKVGLSKVEIANAYELILFWEHHPYNIPMIITPYMHFFYFLASRIVGRSLEQDIPERKKEIDGEQKQERKIEGKRRKSYAHANGVPCAWAHANPDTMFENSNWTYFVFFLV
jgi:hypothetical protein